MTFDDGPLSSSYGWAGEKIDAEKLRITEEAEDFLHSIGFSDFRVRMLDGKARIQLQSGQFPLLIENSRGTLLPLKKNESVATASAAM